MKIGTYRTIDWRIVMKLDPKDSTPLHVQVKDILSDDILNGYYRGKIPSERDLMERFSISRTTVREALSILVREGYLEKKRGKGTFVSMKSVQDWLGQLRSFSETVRAMGMKPSFKLLQQGKVTLPVDASDIFEAEKSYLIKRILYANGIPVAIEEQYYPIEIGYQLADYNLNTAVLYDILESELDITLSEAEQSISAELPSTEEADYLDIPRSIVLLKIERLIFDARDQPVEYLRGCYRTDMYSFKIRMSRKGL